jgi:hypothetical protein
VVELISKKSDISEEEVARIAIRLTNEHAPPPGTDQSAAHVGST